MEPENPSLISGNTPRIACPACRSGELAFRTPDEVHCPQCDALFQAKNRVIDLLPDAQRQKHVYAGFLEWGFFPRIYESRLWRKGLVNKIYMPISSDDELEVILKASDLKDDDTLLDIACGPGIHSRPYARQVPCGSVVGLDLSMPMLNYASAKAQSEGIENLIFVHGNAHDLPFYDMEFDVVSCFGALHLFPDLAKALSEVFRVLKPGGRFITGAGRWPWQGKFGKKIRDWYQERAGVRGFFREELESFLERAGLTNVVCHYEERSWLIMSATKQ
jgi:SAM-dependent methyltransferase